MTSPPADPAGPALLADLAAQVADLRSTVISWDARLHREGIGGTLVLRAEVKKLRRQVAELTDKVDDALDQAAPAGPPAPSWIGLDEATRAAQLAELRDWAGTVLRPNYGGYELRDCWDQHIHAIWEISTLAAEWHRTYSRKRPDLARALEFYDRWLPATMQRVTAITARCTTQCTTLQRHTWQPPQPQQGPR